MQGYIDLTSNENISSRLVARYATPRGFKAWASFKRQGIPNTYLVDKICNTCNYNKISNLVSLGPGDAITDYLIAKRCSCCKNYIAVDYSDEVINNTIITMKELDVNIAGVRADFEIQIEKLFKHLRNVATEGPIALTLLGNTIGNFTNEVSWLTKLKSVLFRDDRFFVEISTKRPGWNVGRDWRGNINTYPKELIKLYSCDDANITNASEATKYYSSEIIKGLICKSDRFVVRNKVSMEALSVVTRYDLSIFADYIHSELGFSVLSITENKYNEYIGRALLEIKV
ncbi:L-histidine N(alpha)-methyltransferase [Marichromatium gracile]|uniref:L-histidine N(alpha)-methyltransferase n=1 Tax=Marichromatium gracile TaxID=1048 RepID=UPI001F19B86E|nr:L-histidine N(alpha)-methyltransferase [Marichromatium gracile]MCF1182991.1 L-histidine N(alpha)-methyltransferase [Marichromatium gracile]